MSQLTQPFPQLYRWNACEFAMTKEKSIDYKNYGNYGTNVEIWRESVVHL